VCGGKRTEPDYLDALKRTFPSTATVVVRKRGDSPDHCIEYAIGQSRTEEPAFDEVWCVLDVDQFDFDEAMRRASKHGVELAVSNPCFELWLLLHLAEVTRSFADCREVRRALVKAQPRYDKARLNFGHFLPGLDKAIDRAKRLDEVCGEAFTKANPSSGMWRLVARIVGAG
jgi:hypothetical protein